jgi:hypothetical protein
MERPDDILFAAAVTIVVERMEPVLAEQLGVSSGDTK